MKITIIYDNIGHKPNLKTKWGFSCLVEKGDKRILFDTGGDGDILMENMEKLKIDPQTIDEVFISHDHWDHQGGLKKFLQQKQTRVYLPKTFADTSMIDEPLFMEEPAAIGEGIYTTGELNGIEQSLIVETKRGLMVIVGCSHSGVGLILDTAAQFGKVYGLLGGLHGFDDFERLEDLEFICPTHCTKKRSKILSMFLQKGFKGGAGKVFEFPG